MPYRIEKADTELRIYSGTHHFLSVIHEDGIFDLRPHPGQDPNGWGTSVYIQPFFPGALLRGSVIDRCISSGDEVFLDAHGIVSPLEDSGGRWDAHLVVRYDVTEQRVTADGTYQIELTSPLKNVPGDLNILKIASNYLRHVPQQTGKIQDTGDVKTVEFTFDSQTVPWKIADPSAATFFQSELFAKSFFSAQLTGEYYDVDSRAQGFDPTPIICAYKPSVTLTLRPRGIFPLTVFALCADGVDPAESEKYGRPIHFSEGYWYDNVGITPLILRAECNEQTFYFDLQMIADSIETAA